MGVCAVHSNLAFGALTCISVAGRFTGWSRGLRWPFDDIYLASWPLRRTQADRRFNRLDLDVDVNLVSWPLRRTEGADRRFNRLDLDVEVSSLRLLDDTGAGELVGLRRLFIDAGELAELLSLGPKLSGDRRGEEERNESD